MEENKRQFIEITVQSGLETALGYMVISRFVSHDTAKRVLKLIAPKVNKPRGKKKPTQADTRLKELQDIAAGKK